MIILPSCNYYRHHHYYFAHFCRLDGISHGEAMWVLPVTMGIRLGLRLARGEHEEVRAVLFRLYDVLRDAPQSPASSLGVMHWKVLSLLVTRALLPLGDFTTAAELIRTDPRVSPQQRRVRDLRRRRRGQGRVHGRCGDLLLWK